MQYPDVYGYCNTDGYYDTIRYLKTQTPGRGR
jgi:hypothetical protein